MTLQASFAEKKLTGDALAWGENDRLRVFAGEELTASTFRLANGAGTDSALFSGEAEKDAASYTALYPENGTSDNGKISMVLASEQNDGDTFPMYALSQTTSLSFRNLLGAVVIPVSGKSGKTLASLKFAAKGAAVAGTATLDCRTGELSMAADAADAVTRKCEIELGDTEQPILIALPAQTYAGYVLTLTDSEGETITVKSDEQLTVGRGQTAELPEVSFFGEAPAGDLSHSGTANCYIVTGSGTYGFDATRRGNEVDATIAPTVAEVVWSDVAGLIESLSLDGGRVNFTVGDKRGNAVIGVKASADSEEYLWSWHIWCTEQPADDTYPQNRRGHTYTVMDRALGASSAERGTCDAMLYQWGRKDPFTNRKTIYVNGSVETSVSEKWYKTVDYMEIPDDGNNNLTYAVRHPDTYISGKDRWCREHDYTLWGNQTDPNAYPSLEETVKTIYDPCPQGYRIAPKDTWCDWDEISRKTGFDSGYEFIYNESEDKTAWLSAAGSRCCQSNAMYEASGLYEVGKHGYYWTNSRYPYGSYMMYTYFEFLPAEVYYESHFYASAGYAVRCVKEL